MALRHRNPPGFTLAEVVVALTLLAFGALAVASGLASVIRMASEGRALTEVATLAASRVARVRAEGCASVGQETTAHYTVIWSGTGVPGGRIVTVAVRRMTHRGIRVDSLNSFQRCPP